MTKYKVHYILRVILTALVLGAIGGLALWARAYATEVFDVLLIAVGIGSVLLALPVLVLSVGALFHKQHRACITLGAALVQMGIGVVFSFFERNTLLVSLLLIAFSVVLPAVYLVMASDRRRQLRAELPKLLLGLFLLAVSLASTERTMCAIFGIGLIAIAILYLAVNLLGMKKRFAM